MTNLKKLSKRGLAMFVAVVMCLGMLQLPAFAAEGDEPSEVAENNIELNESNTDDDANTDESIITDTDSENNIDADDSEEAEGSDIEDAEGSDAEDAEEAEDNDAEDVGDAEDNDAEDTGDAEGSDAEDAEETEGSDANANAEDVDESGISLADLDEVDSINEDAGVIVVTTAEELKDAISNAEDGAVIDVQADIDNYATALSAAAYSRKSVTIMSSNGSKLEDYYRSPITLHNCSLTLENITVNCTGNNARLMCISVWSGTLTIGAGASITNITVEANGGTVVLDGNAISGKAVNVKDGTFVMNSGSVDSVTVASKGTFVMNGGTSGSVTVSGGTFNMTGGDISGSTDGSDGGGVNVTGGTFNMSGGTISGNTATYGGGVYVGSGSTFNMSGGAITGNTATNTSTTYGGGVYVGSGSTFNMSGGTISDNSVATSGDYAGTYGGGVYVRSEAVFTMSGGTISGNTAKYGGGVYAGGTFTMSGGTITGNDATVYGGGVYANGTFNVSGDVNISGNDVYLPAGKAINVSGPLGENVEIKVELAATEKNTMGTQFATGSVTADDVAKFTTNSTTCGVEIKDGAIVLAAPVAYTSADGNTTAEGIFDAMLDLANTNGGTVTLRRDVQVFGQTISNNVTLNLNGHTLDGQGLSYIFYVKGGSLTLEDSVGTGVITGGSCATYGGGVYVGANSTFTMNGGTISGNTAAKYGGGVYVAGKGTFTMNGGTITGNTAGSGGGGVFVYIGANFTLKSGTISNNTTTSYGGGVYVWNANATMEGGTISKNAASYGGGGVFAYNGANFTLKSGTISNNTTTRYGGGVYVWNANATMEGGTISDNTASYGGGGVSVYSGANFALKSGTITDNTATNTSTSYGGGVYVDTNSTIEMTGGTISKNTANYGGGVYVDNYSTIEMTGGDITSNTASNGGGIFIQATATGTISSGYITDNTATCQVQEGEAVSIYPYGGGGIYVNSGKDGTNGKLYLYNVEITNNTAEKRSNIRGVGAGISSCPTSNTKVYLSSGGAIYGNNSVDSSSSVSQVFVDGNNTTHEVFLSGYMLGGGAYNWTDASGDPLANVGVSQTLTGSETINAYNTVTSIPENLAKVFITGNRSAYSGGGIGSNGDVYIGSDLGVLELTKKVTGTTTETSFDFTITLTNADDSVYTGTVMVNGKPADLKNGELEVTLGKDETVLLSNLAVGTKFTITEGETSAVSTTVNGNPGSTAEGTIKAESESVASVVFTNNYVVDEPEPETTSLTVNKVWSDGADAHVNGSVTVNIVNNGVTVATVTLNADNDWTTTVGGLAIDQTYTVEEVAVEGYTPSYTTNDDGSVTITNTANPPENPGNPGGGPSTTSLTVNKVWAGDDEADRPAFVTVQLYRNGVANGSTVTLNDANGWSYTWRGLNDSYTWTVDEVNVPEGYTASVSQSGTTVTITNTYEEEDTEIPEEEPPLADLPDEDPPLADVPEEEEDQDSDEPDELVELSDEDPPLADVPETGDHSALWLLMAGLAGAGIAGVALTGKKREDR